MKQSINIPKRHPTGTGVLKKISTGILELSHITVVLIYFKADFFVFENTNFSTIETTSVWNRVFLKSEKTPKIIRFIDLYYEGTFGKSYYKSINIGIFGVFTF